MTLLLRGLDHVLRAQYATGGWPQFFPPGKGYHRHITFNDGAMVNILEFLTDVAHSPEFSFVDEARRSTAGHCVHSGIECILKCQIKVDGELTIWCAQHDEKHSSRAGADRFEPPALTSSESAGILRLLMSQDKPSPEIKQAVHAAAPGLRTPRSTASGKSKSMGTRSSWKIKVPHPCGRGFARSAPTGRFFVAGTVSSSMTSRKSRPSAATAMPGTAPGAGTSHLGIFDGRSNGIETASRLDEAREEITMADTKASMTGKVVAIWRYPVKSMMGEELNATEVSERGVLGDRAYALIDAETGKAASAKNPRRWPNLFDFRAAYVEPPRGGGSLPPARITLPDGETLTTDQADVEPRLTTGVGRPVRLARSSNSTATIEGYWPDHEWLTNPDKVFEVSLPPGTFFDCATVHLVTTATLDRLRALAPASRFEVPRFRPNFVIDLADGHDASLRERLDRTDARTWRGPTANRRPLPSLHHDDAQPGEPSQGPGSAPHLGAEERRECRRLCDRRPGRASPPRGCHRDCLEMQAARGSSRLDLGHVFQPQLVDGA